MITRVVKMNFNPSFINEFISLFNKVKPLIANVEGCEGVQLLQHETEKNIFFTISKWKNTNALENYRHSELFKSTWAKVKIHFTAKAEAWSLLEA